MMRVSTMNKLYEVSAIRSCEDSIPHDTLGIWLNPIEDNQPPKPVTLSSVYTQEMKENGEIPSVGMEFM